MCRNSSDSLSFHPPKGLSSPLIPLPSTDISSKSPFSSSLFHHYCSILLSLNRLTLCCWANILSRTIDPGSERKLPRAENFVFNSSAVFSNRLSNAGHMYDMYNYVPVEESSSCITHPSSSSIFFLMAAFEQGSCFQFWFFNIYLQFLLLCVSPLWRSHWSPWLSQQTNNFSK